jgi:hypothetical protein
MVVSFVVICFMMTYASKVDVEEELKQTTDDQRTYVIGCGFALLGALTNGVGMV